MYLRVMRDFTQFLGHAPDSATPEELRAFQLDMKERGVGARTFNIRLRVLSFFYANTCPRPEMKRHLHYQWAAGDPLTANAGLPPAPGFFASEGSVPAVPPLLYRRAGKLRVFGDLAKLANPEAFAAHLTPLRKIDWVVCAKPPFGGPEAVLAYLSRYTHRVAISNHRLVSPEAGSVAIRWKSRALLHHGRRPHDRSNQPAATMPMRRTNPRSQLIGSGCNTGQGR